MKKKLKTENVMAFLQALMLSTEFVNFVLEKNFGSLWIGLPGLFLLLFLLLLGVIIRMKEQFYVSVHNIMLLFTVIVYYVFTYTLYGKSMSIQLFQFIGFCLIGYIIMLPRTNYKLILDNLLYISMLGLPVINRLFENIYEGQSFTAISMGASYYFLPLIVAALLHFFYYRINTNVVIKLSYILNLYYAYKLITLGTRGVVISMLVPFLFVLFNKFNKNGKFIEGISVIKLFLRTFVLSICSLIIFNFHTIIEQVNAAFIKNGINFSFIQKTNLLLKSDNADNGRTELLMAGLEGFFEKPVFGNGIGVFEFKELIGPYPHNLFIQLLYDGGLLIAAPIIYWMFKGGVYYLRNKDINKYVIFVLLFCTAIPRLSFSQDFWITPSFWMFMGLVMKSNKNESNIFQLRKQNFKKLKYLI